MGGNGDFKAGLPIGQQDFNVLLDLLMVAAGNGAEPLVARAGLQRESRNGGQQAVEGKGIIIAQDIERFAESAPAGRKAESAAARSG